MSAGGTYPVPLGVGGSCLFLCFTGFWRDRNPWKFVYDDDKEPVTQLAYDMVFATEISGKMRGIALVLLAICSLLTMSESHAVSDPICPAHAEAPYPEFGDIGEAPNVAAWSDLVALPENCHVSLQSPAALTIALSGRFTHAGPVDEIAARLGAISKTKNLPYWSVTDGDWRELVSDAVALKSRDKDSVRSDFTAQEMLSGQILYFAQNDTRSWGDNVYSVRAISSSPDHLIVESDNVSTIRLGPVALFEPDDVRSVLFIDQLDDTTWTYFSLSVIRHSGVAAREKSLINRQAAFYRLLIGQAPDQEPPLAP